MHEPKELLLLKKSHDILLYLSLCKVSPIEGTKESAFETSLQILRAFNIHEEELQSFLELNDMQDILGAIENLNQKNFKDLENLYILLYTYPIHLN